MKICKNCGSVLEDDALFCNECGTKCDDSPEEKSIEKALDVNENVQNTVTNTVSESTNETDVTLKDLAMEAGTTLSNLASAAGKTVSEKANEAKQNYEKSVEASARSNVVLADGEIPVKEYHVTRMFLFRVPGKLLVTNKRIIFYSGSSGSRVVASTPINTVNSIYIFDGRSYGIIKIIIGLILLYISLKLFKSSSGYGYGYGYYGYSLWSIILSVFNSYLPVILLLISILLLYLGTRKALYLSITSSSSGYGLSIGRSNTTGVSHYAINGYSGPDTIKVMNEIGALVLDLQQLGDLAINKWKKK